MGDLSELRGLIVTITFLGILGLLIGLIPYQFYVAGEQSEVYVPPEWEGIDLQAYKEVWNDTTIYTAYEVVAIGGRNMIFSADYGLDRMFLLQQYGLGLLWMEGGTWYNRKNIVVSSPYPVSNHQYISRHDLDNDYEDYGSVEFTIKFSQNAPFQVQVFFTFNETTYDTPSEAWLNDALNILIGIDFDNINTSYNAWDLVAMLLFFNLPDVHWIINALISVPIWITVAYLAYVLVIKVIPLIAGG